MSFYCFSIIQKSYYAFIRRYYYCRARSQSCEKRLLASSCLSVRQHGTTLLPLDGFSWNLIFGYFFENPLGKFEFCWNRTRISGTLREGLCTSVIISRSVLLRTRNFSDKSCRENQNTHFVLDDIFPENHVFYEIIWRNAVQLDITYDNIIWRMHIACWMPEATDTHWEYVILIAFPRNNG
jgi:hypothetical protein